MPDNSASNFIEHVRTVHFALLITSLSLAIASLHNRSSIVKEAARELGIVRDLEDDLKPSNIEHLIRQQVEKEIGGPAPEMDAERSVRLRFKRDDGAPKEITITHPLLGASEGLAECLHQGGTEVGSLAHFASRWDNLNPRPRAPEVYYGGGNLSAKGVLVEGTNETNEANDQSIKPEDFEVGEEVKVETLSTEESNMVAFDIDIVSGMRGSVYLRPSQFHRQAATTVSSDGKHLMVAGAIDESDRSKYQAYVWNLGDPSLKHNFVMDLSRSQTTPVMAISPGALFAAATYLTPPRSGGSVRYWIKVFRPVAGQTVEPLQLFGRAPVAFGEASGQMLYKADSGAGFVSQVLPADAGTLPPQKPYLSRLTVTALRASARGSWCFAVGNENSTSQTKMGTAYAVNLATGIEEELGKFGSEVGASRISTALDGKTVVVSGELLEDSRAVANSLRVWRVTDGAWKSIGDVSVERKSAIATSPSGKLIAIASAGTIRFLRGSDLSEQKQIHIANADLEEITFGQSEDRLTCILGRGNYSESGYLTKMDDEPLYVAADNISLPSATAQTDPKSLTLLVEFASLKKDKKDISPCIPLDIQAMLRSKLLGLRWRTGSFENSFPALATVTKHYRDLPLEKIEKIVQDELSRSGESVEAFGLKVPADALRQWGTLIVLAIQVYFSRHLRFMRRIHMDSVKEAKSAWIGLYDDKVSQYGTLVTGVVLPFVACLLLLGFSAVLDYQANRLQWTTCCYGLLGLCVSGYLAHYTHHELRGLWSAMARRG